MTGVNGATRRPRRKSLKHGRRRNHGNRRSNGRKRRRTARLAGAALVSIALSGSGCSMLDQFNPFGGDKYKMEVTPDVPASKTYDQGLEKLANGSPGEAAKKFTDLGKQYPTSDWARKGLLMSTYAQYQAGDYTTAEASAERYLKDYPNSPEADYILYLRANSYYMQIPDISRDQEKPESTRDVSGRRPEIPEVGIRGRRRIQDRRSPRINWPARKCRSGGSTSPAATTPPPSTDFATYSNTIRRPAMRPKRCIAWLRPILAGITQEAQTAAAVLGQVISRTANGTMTPTTC